MLGLLSWIGIYVLQIQGGDWRRNGINPLDSAGNLCDRPLHIAYAKSLYPGPKSGRGRRNSAALGIFPFSQTRLVRCTPALTSGSLRAAARPRGAQWTLDIKHI